MADEHVILNEPPPLFSRDRQHVLSSTGERAAIVAWLRRWPKPTAIAHEIGWKIYRWPILLLALPFILFAGAALDIAAEEIERGDHIKDSNNVK